MYVNLIPFISVGKTPRLVRMQTWSDTQTEWFDAKSDAPTHSDDRSSSEGEPSTIYGPSRGTAGGTDEGEDGSGGERDADNASPSVVRVSLGGGGCREV